MSEVMDQELDKGARLTDSQPSDFIEHGNMKSCEWSSRPFDKLILHFKCMAIYKLCGNPWNLEPNLFFGACRQWKIIPDDEPAIMLPYSINVLQNELS